MKKLFLFSLSVFSFGMVALAQEKASETRNVDPFTGVAAHDGVNVYISLGTQKVEVKADSDIISKVKTVVKNGVLNVETDLDWSDYKWSGTPSVNVYVTLPSINHVSASGGSDVYSGSVIKSSDLKIRSSGGADVKLELDAEKIDVSSSGGSDIELRGTAVNAKMDASGGSDIDAARLKVQVCEVEASGGADISVNVEKEINARASGGADISYEGNPGKVNVSESGGGDISKE